MRAATNKNYGPPDVLRVTEQDRPTISWGLLRRTARYARPYLLMILAMLGLKIRSNTLRLCVVRANKSISLRSM